jgi:lipoprotein signal peptidase
MNVLKALDDKLPRGWKTALLALALVVALNYYFAQSASTALWLLSKLLTGGVVGYMLDRMAFPNDRPHQFDDRPNLKTEAWRRRAIIIAGCAVAAGVSA